jgi:hypothetical protein
VRSAAGRVERPSRKTRLRRADAAPATDQPPVQATADEMPGFRMPAPLPTERRELPRRSAVHGTLDTLGRVADRLRAAVARAGPA